MRRYHQIPTGRIGDTAVMPVYTARGLMVYVTMNAHVIATTSCGTPGDTYRVVFPATPRFANTGASIVCQ